VRNIFVEEGVFMAMPNVGTKAPEFTLPVSREQNVSLKDYEGKKNIVLAFYPLDFTGGWQQELTNLEKDRKEFEARDAQVLSVSVDSPFSHKAFAEKMGGINFPMLSDFYPHGAVCSLYDCLRPQGYPKRAVFIIDKQGVVRFAKEYDKGIPENPELLSELDKINKG
jgi:mycoredoxin-dependent peroxiredoxin